MLEVEEKIMSTKNYLMHLKSETKKGKGLSRATNMAIFFFLKKKRHLVTYEFGPSKMQVHHCLGRRDERKFVKDIKDLPSRTFITLRKFVPRRTIWKLNEGSVRIVISPCAVELKQSSEDDGSAKGYWDVLETVLPQAADRTCRWIKSPTRYRETCW